jgi:hypothetical protein
MTAQTGIIIETPNHSDTTLLPESILIAGLPYKINHREMDGYYYNLNTNLSIDIDNKGSAERQAQWTFSAIIYASLYEWGMNNVGTSPNLVLNNHLTKGLYQLVRDNGFGWVKDGDSSAVEKFYIGGVTYTIMRRKQDNLYGTCDYAKTLITLDKNETARMVKTLIHEILHAWFYEIGFDGHGNETYITRLEVNLYQLFRDNDFSWVSPPTIGDKELEVLAPAVAAKDIKTSKRKASAA